jgi:hypothetical protein
LKLSAQINCDHLRLLLEFPLHLLPHLFAVFSPFTFKNSESGITEAMVGTEKTRQKTMKGVKGPRRWT